MPGLSLVLRCSVALTWIAPPECPSRDTVQREIAVAAGRSAPRDIVADANVERVSDRVWRLRLATQIDGTKSERWLEAPSCAELAEAAALVLAIEAGADERSTRSAEPEAPALPIATEDSPPERAPGSASRWFAVGVSGGIDVGALASPALGVGAWAAWLPGRTRLAIDVVYFPPAGIERSGRGIGGQFDLFVAGATACRSLLDTKLDLAPCAGVEAGRIAAQGTGSQVVESIDEARPWVALRAGALLAYPVGRFAVRADLGAVVPLVRDRFLIAGLGTVHTPAPVTLRGLVGVEVRFP
jgi:hypothetical protein